MFVPIQSEDREVNTRDKGRGPPPALQDLPFESVLYRLFTPISRCSFGGELAVKRQI